MLRLLTLALLLLVPSFAEGQLFRRPFAAVATRGPNNPCGNPNCPMCYPRTASPAGAFTTTSGAKLRNLTPRLAPITARVDRIATPDGAIDAFLDMFPLRPQDVLYDVGCGDGRVLEAAVKAYGCVGVGIEIDPDVADKARARLYNAGLTCDQVRIVTGDATQYELTGATLVYMYQTHEVMRRVLPNIPPEVTVVSCKHTMPDIEQTRVDTEGGVFYVRQP